MNDPFSEYVGLLDDIERIPVTAREAPKLTAEQRAAAMSQVVALVRDRVLPQADREDAGLDALLDDGGDVSFGAVPGGLADHDAILARVDELAGASPTDVIRVQDLLYGLHSALAGHFSEAEVILSSRVEYEIAAPVTAHNGASRWFG